MGKFEAQDPSFESRVRESFDRQRIMAEIGATMHAVRPGAVEIALPYQEKLTQQHGFVHAGVVSTILDSACGYAAFSLMPADAGVLTVEFKVNLMAPATGERFVARGEVLRPGRTLTICQGTVTAIGDGGEALVASMQATMMTMIDREGVRG